MSILDASVILKWFVKEADSDQALQLRKEFLSGEREIIVPDLLLVEAALAEELDFEFITADEKFCRKVGKKVKAPVKLLTDLKR